MKMRLTRNMATCNLCLYQVISRHRHDFVTCKCGNLSVDGGLEYAKRCFQGDKDSWTEMSEYADIEEQP